MLYLAIHINKSEFSTRSTDTNETVYTLGAVVQLEKINVAAEYAFSDTEAYGKNRETDGYALGLAYNATTNLTISTTYNIEEYNVAAEEFTSFDSDDWFTVGVAYRINEHLALVAELKAFSEEDDQIFLRANLSL